MNDKGSLTPEDDLRAALAPDDSIAPLDPARVIAGARRRRKVRGLATAGIAVIAVAGVATGGVLAGNQLLGSAPDPANPGPTTLVSPSVRPTTQPTPRPPTSWPSTPDAPGTAATPSSKTPGAGSSSARLTPSSCVAALNGEPGPGSSATRRNRLSDESGETILIADSRYWTVCDNTWGEQVSARKPERLRQPSSKDTDAFAVANDTVGERDFYWAGGMLPDGVAAVRYTFPDGRSEDAAVAGGFWLMRHLSDASASAPPTTEIRVRLLSASGAVVNDFQLVWGEQTCAQISHGC